MAELKARLKQLAQDHVTTLPNAIGCDEVSGTCDIVEGRGTAS